MARLEGVAGTLVFEVDGEDKTAATLKATQAEIDDLLSPHLPRVLFHSQASVMGLLEAADAKFKEALAPIVDLSLWQACALFHPCPWLEAAQCTTLFTTSPTGIACTCGSYDT